MFRILARKVIDTNKSHLIVLFEMGNISKPIALLEMYEAEDFYLELEKALKDKLVNS